MSIKKLENKLFEKLSNGLPIIKFVSIEVEEECYSFITVLKVKSFTNDIAEFRLITTIDDKYCKNIIREKMENLIIRFIDETKYFINYLNYEHLNNNLKIKQEQKKKVSKI